MRHVCAALAAVAVVAAAAGEAQAQDYEGKLQAKLEKPFVKHVPWVLDFDEAKAKAEETGKPIFAYFTRSYAP